MICRKHLEAESNNKTPTEAQFFYSLDNQNIYYKNPEMINKDHFLIEEYKGIFPNGHWLKIAARTDYVKKLETIKIDDAVNPYHADLYKTCLGKKKGDSFSVHGWAFTLLADFENDICNKVIMDQCDKLGKIHLNHENKIATHHFWPD